MTIDLIKFAFVGGEVAPAYYSRSDLEKFDLALAEAENWQVDYHGGLANVPGTELVDFVQHDQYPTKFFAFRFTSDIANTNVVLFGRNYIRFIQDGAYVLEAEQSISAVTKASPGVVTSVAHGLATDDVIQILETGEMTQLAGRLLQVTVLTSDTFSLRDMFGENYDTSAFTTYVSGGSFARVYTLASPYHYNDLTALRSNQIRDVLRLTHPDYPIYNLRRSGQADWSIELENLSSTITIPEITAVSLSSTGDYSVAFVVTAVDITGKESLPSDHRIVTDAKDYETSNNGTVTLQWTPVTDAIFYNVYRTRLSFNNGAPSTMSRSYQTGYIGQSRGASFVDSGITPDFTKTPPQGNNPFAPGAITHINVLNGGTGYAASDTITVTDPNPAAGGFIGYPIVSVISGVGQVTGVVIVDGGHDYTSPTIVMTVGGVAQFEARVGGTTGKNPAVSAVYQQRQVYGGLRSAPLTVFGSRPGQLDNFNASDITVANDSYEHEIDSDNNSAIRHLIPTRGGLIVCTAAGIWLMAGSQGNAITATDVQAEPQTFNGVSEVEPLKIDTDIIYVSATGGRVNALAYADQYKIYSPTDISILSSHLLEKHRIVRWAYADEPSRLIWAVRNDGTILLLTMIKDQEIYAWTRRVTKGVYLDVITLDEGDTSAVYVMTRRLVGGRYTKFIERVCSREFETVEDARFLDCSLSYTKNYPDVALQIEAVSGTAVNAVADGVPFTVGDVGKIIRFGAGKAVITAYVNPGEVTLNVIRPFNEVVPFTVMPRKAEAGEWTLDTETTVVTGLHHLEGETVTALADGNVVAGLVVSGGSVTLPQAASRIVVGIPYKSTAKNLPLSVPKAVVENKRQRVTALNIRVVNTRGLKVGNRLTEMYAAKERTTELLGEPTSLANGLQQIMIEPIWEESAQTYLVQSDPLPATILGYVLETEIGDDPD